MLPDWRCLQAPTKAARLNARLIARRGDSLLVTGSKCATGLVCCKFYHEWLIASACIEAGYVTASFSDGSVDLHEVQLRLLGSSPRHGSQGRGPRPGGLRMLRTATAPRGAAGVGGQGRAPTAVSPARPGQRPKIPRAQKLPRWCCGFCSRGAPFGFPNFH